MGEVPGAEDFCGRWAVCDDGWSGTLTLALDSGTSLAGTLHSDRFDADYAVSGSAGDPAAPHVIEFSVLDFNWLPRQDYTSYLMSHGPRALSGTTTWQATPYGFFATRAARLTLTAFRAGTPRPSDFAGGWNARIDGEPGTFTLDADDESGTVRGTCELADRRLEVTGTVDPGLAHHVALKLTDARGTCEPSSVTGYLMTRPKNAVSGWLGASDTPAAARRGFFMVRYC